ncbi:MULTISPECIES: NupC/NupG family nucleoside CNT transporter [unclassified Caulobacter]|uniref:NupC/NupG family nucleoside CNT transporter n=1 Tax=unclassified Caulobacter TaxID=2648921 RepID=UPI000D37269A|nr:MULTISPECIES: nucleoside transporter C-terminal domain-containing protein [unclassified Caulobacter]PTS91215.1 Na+ dependent nucleoside transporter [Caulobacter sp. HMWF009]PTT10224.1 Na+ dependent nucleoside transporter [Caulobacter sp. HMWF025]
MFRPENVQALAGLALTLGLCWLVSENRKRFPWVLAVGAIVVQVGLVLLLFGLPQAQAMMRGVNGAVEGLASSSQAGTAFVFGFLSGNDAAFNAANPGAAFVFAFRVMPVILVVCALSALLWHWGILKLAARAFGFIFQKTLGLRGPPALATAATIFMGQIEGPIFIRAYLDKLTRSELFMLIAVGMACVSGSTMVAYATILADVLPNAAAHVLTASIISAPAGVLLARIIVPSDPLEKTSDLDLATEDKTYGSAIDAVMKGTTDGLQIALNVGATLIVFVALATMVDKILGVMPPVGGQPLSIARGLGVVFAPLAWSMGIPWKEAGTAGGLLGVKLILTEFTAFIQMSKTGVTLLDERTRMIMTYALCGFANVGSVGMNVAGFSVLVPHRRQEVLSLVWKAMMAGFLATCLTGSLIGLMPRALFGL